MKPPLLLVANWKMMLDPAQEFSCAKDIIRQWHGDKKIKIVLSPSFLGITDIAREIKSSKTSGISIGAQDCFFENRGAFTGEVSPAYLKKIGCRSVILGHSERRLLQNESDEIIAKKIAAAHHAGLMSIICIGETKKERRAGTTPTVLARQLRRALGGVAYARGSIVIAYEPVWAIGTGQAMSAAEFLVTKNTIQNILGTRGFRNNNSMPPILYGGSVDAKNCSDLVAVGGADGFLVGSASLQSKTFLTIAHTLCS